MNIYKNPLVFTLLAVVTVLIGTIAMVFIPMVMESTQPHNELQKPYTALELAGRDVYQQEGCNNCHTQTVRPLKAEVVRYGPYSKAWEFEYDHPFIWGSRRTGPDLARLGGKYSDKWHYRHMDHPAKIKYGSNMPRYDFLGSFKINASRTETGMKVLGFPYTPEDIKALEGMSQLDALIAYLQMLGTAVERPPLPQMIEEGEKNPFAGDAKAIARGKKLFELNCTDCHAIDPANTFALEDEDLIWLTDVADFEGAEIFDIVANGTVEGVERREEGGMPPFSSYLGKEKIWSIVSYLHSVKTGE